MIFFWKFWKYGIMYFQFLKKGKISLQCKHHCKIFEIGIHIDPNQITTTQGWY